MAGTTDDGGTEDVWLVRGSPCWMSAASRIGDPGGQPTQESGHDLRELAVGLPGVPAGSLAIAGRHAPLFFGDEASLLLVDPTLVPIGGTSVLFGDVGSNGEAFFSLAEDPAGWPQSGIVLAGLTRTDWEWAGDPQDLYLVHYDPAAGGCQWPWSPGAIPLTWNHGSLGPQLHSPAIDIPVSTAEQDQWNPWPVCP